MEREELPWSERRKVLLEGHRRNPFTTTLTGGRVLSAVQLPWFTLVPPSGYGVLTTKGRRTGKRRRKCVRVVRKGDRAFLVAIPGSAAAWITNIRADPRVHLRIRGARRRGIAREIRDEQELLEAREAYCDTVRFFDHGAFVLHWPGRPTAPRIRELLELWFENGVVVAVDLAGASTRTSGRSRPYTGSGPPTAVGRVAGDYVHEREAFRATLAQVGPEAPTVCGSWTTTDLAVHVVTGEVAGALANAPFRLLVGRGIRIDWMAPLNMWALRRYRPRHGFEWALRRLRRDPPRLHCHPAVAPVSLLEVWAHHEDVLDANDVGRCDSGIDLSPVLQVLVRYQRRSLAEHGVRVISGGAVWYEPPTDAMVEVTGEAAGLARWLAGRAGLEPLTVSGEANAIEEIKASRLRL